MLPLKLTGLPYVKSNTLMLHNDDCQETSIAVCAVHCSPLGSSAYKIDLQSPALSLPHKGAIDLIVESVVQSTVTVASDATVSL